MKTKKLLLSSLIAIPAIALLTSTTVDTTNEIAVSKFKRSMVVDTNGKLGNTGAPGEFTCSEATCHGAGNGSSTTGGLADNAGPGSIAITTVPALVGNQYVPNTTYSITITVSQHGIAHFGFSFEALDNSGSTNLSVNNAVGIITITDPVHTREGQPFGTGRNCATHQTNGGAFNNAANFNFNWTAPASGIVNLYYDGIAADGDKLPDAQDNVYANTMQLSPHTTGINNIKPENMLFEIFPNPATDMLTVRLNLPKEDNVTLQLFSLEGKLVKTFADKKAVPSLYLQSFSTDGIAKGIYILKASTGTYNKTQRLIIN